MLQFKELYRRDFGGYPTNRAETLLSYQLTGAGNEDIAATVVQHI